MIDLTDGIDSLTNFKRRTPAYLNRLRKTGQPLVLTVNGKAQVVVQDAASYQELLELVDRLEAVEKIQQGLDDVRKGRTRSLDKIIAEKKKKHGL
jgi:prevent-host-death family protein